MKTIIIALLLLSTPLYAGDPWSSADIYREAACVTLNLMDSATTDKILGESDRAMELNPFIGPHPSRNTIWAVGIGSSVLHALVANYIPAKYRAAWQYSWISIKVLTVGNNLHVGLGIQF